MSSSSSSPMELDPKPSGSKGKGRSIDTAPPSPIETIVLSDDDVDMSDRILSAIKGKGKSLPKVTKAKSPKIKSSAPLYAPVDWDGLHEPFDMMSPPDASRPFRMEKPIFPTTQPGTLSNIDLLYRMHITANYYQFVFHNQCRFIRERFKEDPKFILDLIEKIKSTEKLTPTAHGGRFRVDQPVKVPEFLKPRQKNSATTTLFLDSTPHDFLVPDDYFTTPDHTEPLPPDIQQRFFITPEKSFSFGARYRTRNHAILTPSHLFLFHTVVLMNIFIARLQKQMKIRLGSTRVTGSVGPDRKEFMSDLEVNAYSSFLVQHADPNFANFALKINFGIRLQEDPFVNFTPLDTVANTPSIYIQHGLPTLIWAEGEVPVHAFLESALQRVVYGGKTKVPAKRVRSHLEVAKGYWSSFVQSLLYGARKFAKDKKIKVTREQDSRRTITFLNRGAIDVATDDEADEDDESDFADEDGLDLDEAEDDEEGALEEMEEVDAVGQVGTETDSEAVSWAESPSRASVEIGDELAEDEEMGIPEESQRLEVIEVGSDSSESVEIIPPPAKKVKKVKNEPSSQDPTTSVPFHSSLFPSRTESGPKPKTGPFKIVNQGWNFFRK